MDKKTDAFTVHLPNDIKKQAIMLARTEGMTLSEWALGLIDAEIAKKEAEYSILRAVFENKSSNSIE